MASPGSSTGNPLKRKSQSDELRRSSNESLAGKGGGSLAPMSLSLSTPTPEALKKDSFTVSLIADKGGVEKLKSRYFPRPRKLSFDDEEEEVVGPEVAASAKSSEEIYSEARPLIEDFYQCVDGLDFSCGWELDRRRFLSSEEFSPVIEKFYAIYELRNDSSVNVHEFCAFLRLEMFAFLRKIQQEAIASYERRLKRLQVDEDFGSGDKEFDIPVAEANIVGLKGGDIETILAQLRECLNVCSFKNDYPRKPTNDEIMFYRLLVGNIFKLNLRNINKNPGFYRLPSE
ncbi:MAG: hypothetical protein K940chlam8_00037 [Chlamydiae bacterium]|nr:hypothetical protein [Chlamydiota bacterium]